MPSRSARNSRYDDPYVFDQPYHASSPPNHAYEYIGTDDPSGFPEHRQQTHESSRRSPPRRSRHGREHTPPPPYHDRNPSPPRHQDSRRAPSPPRAAKASAQSKLKNLPNKYQEFAQRPGFQRAQTYGRKGLNMLGEAAVAYAAAQNGGKKAAGPPSNEPRTRSAGQDIRGGRDKDYDQDRARRHRHHRNEDSYYDSEGPSRHNRRHHRRHSPSPSPSPIRRSKTERHNRRRDPSESSSSRDPSRDRRHRGRHHRDTDRDRPRRRAYSYSPSPPPRSRGRTSRGKSTDHGAPRARSATTNRKNEAAAEQNNERWQMAMRSALEAGGLAALRLRKQPGSWTGDKGAKIAQAALGAAAIDAFMDKDPRTEQSRGVKGMAQTAITGLIASKLAGKARRGKQSR